jgi:hypothetical protein
MNLADPSVKIVHCDYNESLRGELVGQQDCKGSFGAKRNTDTNKITGFFFRWHIRLYSHHGIFLSAIGEDSYSIDDPSEMKAEEMEILMKRSVIDFKIKLTIQLDNPILFDIPIDLSLAASFLIELSQ